MVTIQKKIKKLLIDRDISGSILARECGVTRWAIYQVFAGRTKSPRLRQHIAARLGTTPGRLWPRESRDRSDNVQQNKEGAK